MEALWVLSSRNWADAADAIDKEWKAFRAQQNASEESTSLMQNNIIKASSKNQLIEMQWKCHCTARCSCQHIRDILPGNFNFLAQLFFGVLGAMLSIGRARVAFILIVERHAMNSNACTKSHTTHNLESKIACGIMKNDMQVWNIHFILDSFGHAGPRRTHVVLALFLLGKLCTLYILKSNGNKRVMTSWIQCLIKLSWGTPAIFRMQHSENFHLFLCGIKICIMRFCKSYRVTLPSRIECEIQYRFSMWITRSPYIHTHHVKQFS